MEFYQRSTADVVKAVDSTEQGLSSEQVQSLLQRNGYNELKDKERVPTWKLFIETFKDPMVVVLLAAAGVQIIIGELVESLIIFLVLLINSIISVVQTRKAESSLEALKDMSAPSANVIRDRKKQTIEARGIVQGDVVYLEAGDYVPADGRVLKSGSLKVNEGMLTGESEAVEKTSEVIEEEVALGDQRNMVFSSSLVVYGRGEYVVTGTAENTEVGKIADMLSTAEQKETPLQRKLNDFSKKLGLAILLLCVLIFAVQAARIWFGDGQADTTSALINALMFSVAIAVAAIPEALQSIVTIVLSVGTNKMANQHAIIRKLPAVETLGSTSIICTDKTGTLTQNKMTVTDYFLPLHNREHLPEDEANWDQAEHLLVQISTLCNDSYINQANQEVGDPTEVALIHFANQHTDGYQSLRDRYPRIAELPFDSDRKLMSTLHQMEDSPMMLVKGGPDVMFQRASYVLVNGEEHPLTENMLNRFEKANEEFSNQALRGLAYAYKRVTEGTTELRHDYEHDFVLVGLTAMMDPPREEVFGSIAQAKKAGIRPIMITGDHKTTAQAIGRQIGLMDEEDIAVTGKELDTMSAEELEQKLDKISIYARVSPENKIRIVRAWQNRNAVTAMTGDGVNDAPALKQADIGIAMGSGTEVAKDASAMILTDDNFVSIVNAVQVGRTVYENIKKAISYLFAGNLGAILTILYAVIFNLPNPFTALQLLFINLVNDSLPAIALGVEKSEPNVMERKPRPTDEGIFAGQTIQAVLTRGLLIAIAVTSSFYIGLSHSNEMGVAMAFTTLILSRTLQTFATRSNTQSAISIGLFSNKYVVGAVALGFVLYGITVLPFARDVFHIPAAFGLTDWGIAAGLALGAVIMMEIVKVLRYRKG
ncbi:HAD-IC family P-type ATPase [Pontibacillus yanchengensis]|uniref:HAD-IC family P-type ATPase n=1 Tax=Pontibacillus yanchengensis TaxID=462910 RepID=A0A6I5A678_9BACI|nr:cation-translocating P-type ATPase [Pontibacillus yanchengensis]MYL35803.1 HAD-IC family P-type ATPase [Pontibacillus yanchengensis]